MNENLTYTPIGGAGGVTRNMHAYEYKNEILIVDCGIGFADDTVLGVELVLPDISYLKSPNKKIVGMAITHGHEDHFGALPFVLPDLPSFPIFATPLTAEFANEKLKEFGVGARVKKVDFDGGEVKIGSFSIDFIRVTHSVPDSSNIFIKTPVGNIYHGSDFKFEPAPYDGKTTDFKKITNLSAQGVMCLMCDGLRAEQTGKTPSEAPIYEAFLEEFKKAKGKIIVTTYSSNIARLNQIVKASSVLGKKICFVGRSVIKAKEIAERIGYLKIEKGMEVYLDNVHQIKDQNIVMIVAGSQGQESSALARIVNGDHKDVKLNPNDTVIFSADPIPGNEVSVNSLIDEIARKGARVLYSSITDAFHVSGHAASEDLIMMMDLVKPKKVLPIGATFKQMAQYKELAKKQGFADKDIILVENGQQVVFTKEGSSFGKKIKLRNIYVDQISGEEVESFVLRDRQKLASDGIVIVMVEIDADNGQPATPPNIIVRGLAMGESKKISLEISKQIKNSLSQKKGRVTDWTYMRKFVQEISEKYLFRNLRKRPLVIPVVIEV